MSTSHIRIVHTVRDMAPRHQTEVFVDGVRREGVYRLDVQMLRTDRYQIDVAYFDGSSERFIVPEYTRVEQHVVRLK